MTVLRSHLRALSACLAALAFLACGAPRAGAAQPPQPRTYLKADYPVTVPIEVPNPNVLFLLDVGSQMVFTPKGIMPLAPLGSGGYKLKPGQDVEFAEYLKECTFGSGGYPLVGWGGDGEGTATRWGRDLDNSNNEIGSADCYYSSKPGNPWFLTFKNGSLPAGVTPGMKVTGYPHYANSPYPAKPFFPNSKVYDQLVPNDSRMYMMKLVLWRLTEPENAELLSNMNIAIATNIQDQTFKYKADVYKSAPYGMHGVFKYGRAPDWAIGQYSSYNDSTWAAIGIDRGFYSAPPGSQTWNHVHRAILLAPFDRFYVEDTPGHFNPTPHLAGFRKYIDGVEEATNTKPCTFINPELFADGQSPISTALYARDYIGGKKDMPGLDAIRYAPSNATWGGGGQFHLALNTSTTTENLNAGQALGSAIDFFSPLGLPFSRGAGFFPVKGTCQSNWVVVFTAGNDEQEGILNGKKLRTAPEAALELYRNSVGTDHPMRGRAETGSGWKEMSYAMDKGIRTLAVGFVDENATDDNSKKLIKALNEVAANGRPKKQGDKWVKDDTQKALFANDVPRLIKNMLDVLKLINADAKAGGGPVGSPKIVMQEETDEGRVYALQYDPQPFDQWTADFTCHNLSILKTGTISMDEGVWRAGALMDQAGSSRRIYTLPHDVGTTGQSVTQIDEMAPERFAQLANVPQSEVKRFSKWLYRPKSVDTDTKATPLGDSQHSNFLKVARGPKSNDIFLQTNRGVLHALDAETGKELWAFIPPLAFQGRIRDMKFDGNRWYAGDGTDADSRRSMPVVTLDGLMSESKIGGNTGVASQRLLLATTGYGGSGIYAMDVTNRQEVPQFLWSVDNLRYAVPEPNPMDGVRRWGAAAPYSREDHRDFNYSDLGLTLQAAALLPISDDVNHPVVGVLPGGLGYNLGQGDSQGKVLYVLNPKDGAILNRLDGSKLTKHAGSPADLGMLLAPVVPVFRSVGKSKDTAVEFFTSDSSGNILKCALTTTNSEGIQTWTKVSDWSLRSVFRVNTVDKGGHDTGKPISSHYQLRRLSRPRDGKVSLVGTSCNTLAPGAGSDKTRQVANEQQFVFLLRLDRLSATSSMKDLAMRTLREVSEKNNAAANHSLVLDGKVHGWFFRMAEPTNRYEGEEPSMAPYIYQGNLFVSTFAREKTAEAACAAVDTGISRLYVLDAETGKASMNRIEMTGLKVVGVTGLRGRLLLSVEEKQAGALNEAAALLNGQKVGNNMLSLTPPGPGQPDYAYGVPFTDYWRDMDDESTAEIPLFRNN